jgi:hypothetical protein
LTFLPFRLLDEARDEGAQGWSMTGGIFLGDNFALMSMVEEQC